ncbi:hypothetical protein AVEN_90919-1, partial [Araneus ventricosus]
SRECTQFDTAHGLFPSYLKRFRLHSALRMWGNRKSPSLHNEMSTNFIISPQGTKPTIHCPLVEEHPANSQDEI